MKSEYLSQKQINLLIDFYKGRIGRFVKRKKIYEKDRWAFVEHLGNKIELIDRKILDPLIAKKYIEIYEDDGFTKIKISKLGILLIENNIKIV